MNTSIVITSILSGIVTWIFMYLDARLFDTPKSKFTYFKGVSFVACLAGLIVYFMGAPKFQIGGAAAAAAIPTHIGTSLVQGIGEEVLTGMPNF